MTGSPGTPTLDQLCVFVTVSDCGSFTAAARKLNRAPSAVSYTIATLETQLGVPLFDRETSRRAQLTPKGHVVLAEARLVVGGVSALRARVCGMMAGIEAELNVVFDALLPPSRIADALSAFSQKFPTVRMHLHTETLGAVAHMVLERNALIGIAGPYADYDELVRISVGRFRMVPVAGREHPLVSGGRGDLAPGAVREHLQLVVYDRSSLTKGRDFSVGACRTWRLADLSAKHTLLRAGIGWGMMPLAMVADDLASGVLVELNVPDLPAFDYPVHAIHRTDSPPGPAGAWMIERFQSQADC